MAFLGGLLQLLLLLLVPPAVLGLVLLGAYRLFCFLVGCAGGRGLLLFWHVPFTPVRELAHLFAAVLFGHRVTNYRILRLNAPDGEMGFVEHTYRKGNPVAVLGNLAVALWPALAVVLTALLALRLLVPEACHSLFEATAHFGVGVNAANVFAAVGALFRGLFGDFQHRLWGKLAFLAIAALLCLGAHVTLSDLWHAVWGAVPFAVVTAGGFLLVSLLDPRICRAVLQGVRCFAVVTAAVELLLAAVACGVLIFGLLFFMFRMLFGLDRRYWRRYYAAGDAAESEREAEDDEPSRVQETDEGQLFYKNPPQRGE